MHSLPLDLARQQRALEWAVALATHPLPVSAGQLAPYQPPGPVACTPGPEVYHLLYCSQSQRPFEEEELADLLESCLAPNARAQITGLLCYGNGHFVQVLEGEATQVEEVFGRIVRDRRHHRVHVLSRGRGPARQFADWRMAFAKNQTQEFYWLITFLQAHHHRLLLRQVPVTEPMLATVLASFSQACTGSRAQDYLPSPLPEEKA